jgi:hypothetical protein
MWVKWKWLHSVLQSQILKNNVLLRRPGHVSNLKFIFLEMNANANNKNYNKLTGKSIVSLAGT